MSEWMQMMNSIEKNHGRMHDAIESAYAGFALTPR
ncbi:hypothetical protein THI_3203 [Thiomonas arsenitoxydans]|uniref:Uncharacterized protein n=1 Tax=Thiomonas arsenitoxydans (strain DSM 22701 / CIP 110005 / 3As) TaxID=426114 RepID=D6CMM2_THIA3|nr:hypothetical protein THI_3203 [Thiomonas arsenitoxydans]